jgi:hypothetical protein
LIKKYRDEKRFTSDIELVWINEEWERKIKHEDFLY